MSQDQRNPRKRPVFKIAAIDDQEKFQPLPCPIGQYPYRLDIEQMLTGIGDNSMSFHMAGDTGGLSTPEYQQQVIAAMIDQCKQFAPDRSQFLFHLGDVVYNHGLASEYYRQFFNPYREYPCPIFAIPGNHDADVDLTQPNPPASLDAFVEVFCNTKQRELDLAGDTGRKSSIQPNVYWILETPLADIIGLYSNVPRFGNVQNEQRQWFIEALKTSSDRDKAIIVCVHHSAYSADTNHGSSIHMQMLIDGAIRESGVFPDIIFSGHVHNYQRFNKTYPGGEIVPFVVAGSGGYAGLHPLANPDDPEFPDTSCLLNGVELQNYCDDKHGFLKIGLRKTGEQITIRGQYFIAENGEPRLFDDFSLTSRALSPVILTASS
jgi:hypothetical protein